MSETRELPGWVWTKLEQIADIAGGVTKGRDLSGRDTITLPYLRVANVQRGYLDLEEMKTIAIPREELDRYSLRSGDVVLTEGGDADKLGRAALWQGQINPCLHQNHIFRARILNGDVAPKWLVYYANSEQGQTYFRSAAKQTVNLASINMTQLRSCPIPLPPFAEQERIVAAIEQQFTRLDAGVAALRRARVALKRYRAAVLKAAVEGRLTEQWRAEHPDVEAAPVLLGRILAERRLRWEADLRARGKDPAKVRYEEPKGRDGASLPELPEGWCWATLEQITNATRPICYGILMPKENVVDGVPYVKVKDMKGDKIDVNALHRTAPEIAAAYSRASLKPRDLLLAIRGTYGRVAEVPDELDGANITQDSARLDVSDQINHQYVAAFLRSETCQTYFRSVARGVAVKGVNIADVKLTAVALPPVAEQEQIVAEVERRLSVVGELEATVEANLKRAERLRQSILREAFAGRLVEQDASDEPAGVLLERIREERAQILKNGHVKSSKPEFEAEQTVEPIAAVQDRLW